MAFSVYNYVGAQGVNVSDTTQRVPLGTIVKGVDPTLGEGEFIYLLDVTGQFVGCVVIYNATTYQTALLTVTNGKGKGVPVAIAMSTRAVGAATFSWYHISGQATIKKTTVLTLPQVPIFISATSGRIKTLLSAGQQILGAQTANLTTVVSTTSTVICTIARPHSQGQIV